MGRRRRRHMTNRETERDRGTENAREPAESRRRRRRSGCKIGFKWWSHHSRNSRDAPLRHTLAGRPAWLAGFRWELASESKQQQKQRRKEKNGFDGGPIFPRNPGGWPTNCGPTFAVSARATWTALSVVLAVGMPSRFCITTQQQAVWKMQTWHLLASATIRTGLSDLALRLRWYLVGRGRNVKHCALPLSPSFMSSVCYQTTHGRSAVSGTRHRHSRFCHRKRGRECQNSNPKKHGCA